MAIDERPGPTGESLSSPADPRLGQTAGELASLPQRIVDIYASNLRIAVALSREYEFECLFFWQPTLFSKRVRSDAESQVVEACPEYRELRPVYASVYSLIAGRHDMPSDFLDLQDVFGDRASTYFLDFCHLNEDGNQIVAEAITQALIRRVSLDGGH